MTYIESPLEHVVACHFEDDDEPPPDPPDELGWACGSYHYAVEFMEARPGIILPVPILGTENPFLMREIGPTGEPDGPIVEGVSGAHGQIYLTGLGIIFGNPTTLYRSPADVYTTPINFRVVFRTFGDPVSIDPCGIGVSHGFLTSTGMPPRPDSLSWYQQFGSYPGASGTFEYLYQQVPQWDSAKPDVGRWDIDYGNDCLLYSYSPGNGPNFGFLNEAIGAIGSGYEWTITAFCGEPPSREARAAAKQQAIARLRPRWI